MEKLIKTIGDLRCYVTILSFACWAFLTVIASYNISTMEETVFRFLFAPAVGAILVYFAKLFQYRNSTITLDRNEHIELTSMTYAVLLLPIGLTVLSIISIFLGDVGTAGWVSIFLLINVGIQFAFFFRSG